MVHVPFEKIKSLVGIEDLFDPVKQSFVAYNSQNLIGVPVSLLHFANHSDVHIKTAAIEGYDFFSIKVSTVFPKNETQHLPPCGGAIFLFDAQTGFSKAMVHDKGLLTDLRTAAAGAVITDFIAAKSANRVAVIGTGTQAYEQVRALSKLRTISTLTIYGRSEQRAVLLKQKIAKGSPGMAINIADHPEKAVKESDIIITTTSSRTPLVKGAWLSKGQHLTAVGADDTFKQEIDEQCFGCADTVFVDSLELNRKYGEYARAIISDSGLSEKTIEFGVAFRNKMYLRQQESITVAKLVGVGVQDLAAATVVMNKLHDEHIAG